MTWKWDLQTQTEVHRNGRECSAGWMNETMLLLLILLPLLLSLQGGIIVLRAPQGQSHGHRYRSRCALCTAAFVTFYKAVAYKMILLENGSFFFVLRYSLSIDLTELTHQFCSVFLIQKFWEAKPFRDLHDKKVRLCWVYNLLKFGLYLPGAPRGGNLWGHVSHHSPVTLTSHSRTPASQILPGHLIDLLVFLIFFF